MSDDWRVRADLHDADGASTVLRGMKDWGLDDDIESGLPERLPVSSNEGSVFVYASEQGQAVRAADTVREVIANAGLQADVSIARWHPDAEEWQPDDVPLPQTPEERAAEHARLEAREAQESTGEEGPQWEVRIDLGSRGEAIEVAQHLKVDGLEPLRRWTHVFISTITEDEANALAERLRGRLPGDAKVSVEGTAAQAWKATHRFAVLGGLGG